MLVSVIIPSYNHEKFLPSAIESVLSQTYDRLELIVIDDGLEDGSVAYLRSVGDPRLRVFTQENSGGPAAINRGLENAQGDYLAILNSDDRYHHERIRTLLGVIDATGADLVCSWIEIVDADGRITGVKQGWENLHPSWWRGDRHGMPVTGNPFLDNILMMNFVSTTSNILLKRSLYERIGGMRNLRFCHDWDFVLRAAAEFPCALAEQALVQYRLHGSNTITSNHDWMKFEICWVIAANLSLYEKIMSGCSDRDESTAARMHGSAEELGRSLVPEGCGRMFGKIREYMDDRNSQGDPHAHEAMLDSDELRESFMKYFKTTDNTH